MEIINAIHLPETAVASDNCLDNNYIFYNEARLIFDKLDEILKSFEDKSENGLSSLYYNNVIGVIGQRGSGKSSLMGSVIRTLQKNGGIPTSKSQSGMICGLIEPIDPKSLPNYIGIIDLFLGILFSDFTQHSNDYDESKYDDIFQRFEKANQIVSMLSQKDRKDVLLNSSDLYQVSEMTSIKDILAKLVDCLLNARKVKDSNSKFKAFLICIDDFDLDSSNCYTMAIELMSFLNIKGVIFLLGMDLDIFEKEISRNRIKELSDYGFASSYVFDGDRSFGSYARRSSLSKSRIDPDLIIESAREYRSHLSIKFIPADFRISMKEHDIGTNGYEIDQVIDYICEWLFGFSERNLPEYTTNNKVFYKICYEFSTTLCVTSNLRSRNQILNKISSILSDSSKIDDINERYFSLINSEIVDLLGNYPSVNKKGRINLKELVNEISSWTMDSRISGLDIGGGQFVHFFHNHPCARWAYNKIVASVDTNDPINGVEDLYQIINIYGVLLNLEVSKLKKVGSDSPSFSFDSVDINVNNYLEYLPRQTIDNLLIDINNAIKSPKRQTKTFYTNLISELIGYGSSNSNLPTTVVVDLQTMRKKLEEVSPWKGDSENKKDFLDRVRMVLERVKRYLK